MIDKQLTEQETKALVERLQQLPDAIEAPDLWGQIKAKLEPKASIQFEATGQKGQQAVVTHRKFWQPMAAAAVLVLAVTFYTISPWQQNVTHTSQVAATTSPSSQKQSSSFDMTLASLELANSQYYGKLGYQLQQSKTGLDPSIRQSLKDLRSAQQQYAMALQHQPKDLQLQQQLIEMYQKERHLLQKVTA